MAKFEYTYLSVDHNKDVMENHIEMLNEWGNRGWELVSVVYPIEERLHGDHSLVFFLRREISDSSEEDC